MNSVSGVTSATNTMPAPGFIAASLSRSSGASPARSVLLSTSRSASAACRRASVWRSSVVRPCTASATVTTLSMRCVLVTPGSVIKACRMGAGSARPEVSISTRSYAIMPASRRLRRSSSVSTRSPRTAQQRQPVVNDTSVSSLLAIRSWSSPISPNSFTMTAVRAYPGVRRIRPISVVLPLPRKPVTTETGVGIISFPSASPEFRPVKPRSWSGRPARRPPAL